MASSQRRFPSIRRHTASKGATYGTSHIKLDAYDKPCTVAPTRGGKSRVRPSDPCVDGDKILMPWNTVGRDLILSDVYTGDLDIIDNEAGDEREWDIGEDDNIFAMISDNDGIDDAFDIDSDEPSDDDTVESDGSISEYEWMLAELALEYEEQDEMALDAATDGYYRRPRSHYDEAVTDATFQSLLETGAYDDVYGDTAHLDWDDSLFDEDYELMLDGEYDWMYHETTDEELLEEIQVKLERRDAQHGYGRSSMGPLLKNSYETLREQRLDRRSHGRCLVHGELFPHGKRMNNLTIHRLRNEDGKVVAKFSEVLMRRARKSSPKALGMSYYPELDDAGLTEFMEMMEFYAEFMDEYVDNDVDLFRHMQMEAAWYWNCEATQRELEAALGPVYEIGGRLTRVVKDDFGNEDVDDDVTDHGYVDYDQVSAVG